MAEAAKIKPRSEAGRADGMRTGSEKTNYVLVESAKERPRCRGRGHRSVTLGLRERDAARGRENEREGDVDGKQKQGRENERQSSN